MTLARDYLNRQISVYRNAADTKAEAGWTVEQLAGFGRLRSLHKPTLCV